MDNKTKENFDIFTTNYNNISNFIAKNTIAVGFLILFFYCSKHRFFPSGITFGDTFIFVWVSISFGIVYNLFVYILFSIGCIECYFIKKIIDFTKLLVHPFCHAFSRQMSFFSNGIPLIKKQNIIVIIGGALVFSIIVFKFHDKDIDLGRFLATGFLVSGGFLLLPQVIKNNPGSYKFGIIASIYLLPLFVGGFTGHTLDQSMRIAGLRHDNSIIELNKEYFQFANMVLSDKYKENHTTLPNTIRANILFSGIGTTSLVQINNINFTISNSYFKQANITENDNVK